MQVYCSSVIVTVTDCTSTNTSFALASSYRDSIRLTTTSASFADGQRNRKEESYA